jgi:rhodanese-related sulfurtransferase
MSDSQQQSKSKIAATLYPAAREAVLIFIITVIVAVIFNTLRPSGIPLFGFSPAKAVSGQQAKIPEITLGEAHDLYLKNKVVFVDARDPFSFEEGHISGAINIYPDEVTLHAAKLKKMVSAGSIVITYCDGPHCPLSKETARGLQLQGVPVVKVLVDGWSLWQNAGYPVAKGNK